MIKARHVAVALFLSLLALSSVSMPRAGVAADPPGPLSSVIREALDGPSICTTGCGGRISPASDVSFEQQVIELVNAERVARGLPPLKGVDALRDAARAHATDMAQDDYFDHDTYDRVDGQLEWVCNTWARIGSYYPSAGGENIAAGYTTPQSVVSGWMESSGHRGLILNAGYREIGAGYHRGGSWRHYWVLDFGTGGEVYPLVINREAPSTDSVYVSLDLYGDWDQVRLRNDDGAWSSWRTFANRLDWTLPARVGAHTVWAEMKKGAQTATSSDTITLLAAPALGNLPGEMHFLYNRSEGRMLPSAAQATPLNLGNGDRFTWQATVTGRCFVGERLGGSDGDSFRIAPADLDDCGAGTHSGAVTVRVVGLDGVAGAPHQIELTLQVVDAPFETIYLPMVSKK